jgi:dihydroxyacetone kinase
LQLSKLCEHSVGGTSGALYALFFGAGSRAFDSEFGDESLRKSIAEGLHAISYYGHAKPGHRTLVDPLDAASKAASNSSWQDLIKV